MADTIIPRDLGSSFHPEDPITGPEQLAEFQGFACDVPSDAGMINAVNNPPLNPTANSTRAARMFRPELVQGLSGGNGLPTPDPLPPSAGATFERRGLHNLGLVVPGLGPDLPIDMWSFEARIDNDRDVDIETWPGPTIRVREGQVVHSILGTRTGPHTIHHHGIEPTPMNDGVGHLTFEVEDGYTYQWRAAEAGTYFYHCHRNTTLHFELGMYGMLIVDPDVPGAPFADGGPGVTLLGNDPVAYDAEAIWVADDIDTRWHGLGEADDEPQNGFPVLSHVAAGLQACDSDGRSGFVPINDPDNPRLHEFRPNVFVVSGQAAPFADNGENLITAAGVSVSAGQKVLVRALNASYCTTIWKFPAGLQATVTAADGRTLGRSETGFGAYSAPYALADIGHEFTLGTAQRWDLLVDTLGSGPGQHLVEIEFRHWITHALLRTVRVPIAVSGSV